MSALEIGGLGIAALFALMLLQVPIGFAMMIVLASLASPCRPAGALQ